MQFDDFAVLKQRKLCFCVFKVDVCQLYSPEAVGLRNFTQSATTTTTNGTNTTNTNVLCRGASFLLALARTTT